MTSAIPIGEQFDGFRKDFGALRREIGKSVVGQQDAVEGMLFAAICGGHVLLEGAPGTGKTLLAETLADVADVSFQRIQFTPDLMPADLIGTYVVMETPQHRRTFEFHKGPLFSHVILADQINRGPPKTQSALLEAMEGESITVSTESFPLPTPFLVLGTQNPLEMEGTYPLPEPQLDRFFCKLILKPPSADQIEAILDRTTEGEPPAVATVVDDRRLLEMRQIARRVPMANDVRRLAVSLVAASHPGQEPAPPMVRRYVRYGCSPRAAQALVLAAKVHALAAGRNEVSQEDVRAVAHPVLRHRVILNFEGQSEDVQPDRVVDEILGAVFGSAASAAPSER